MKITHVEDYRVLRRAAYPSPADLADAMYWASKGDRTLLAAYFAKCEVVKQKFPPITPRTLAEVVNELVLETDALADAARTQVVGDPVRVEEYRVAKEEATAFAAAGFMGAVPPSVSSWKDAKVREGWTNQQAAEDILLASGKWYAALYAIRDARLVTKENLRAATTVDEAQTIFSQFQAQFPVILANI